MVKGKRRSRKGTALALISLLLFGSLAGCEGKRQEERGSGGISDAGVPTSSYTPPVNGAGYVVVTMPITLSGGNTAKESEERHQKNIFGKS